MIFHNLIIDIIRKLESKTNFREKNSHRLSKISSSSLKFKFWIKNKYISNKETISAIVYYLFCWLIGIMGGYYLLNEYISETISENTAISINGCFIQCEVTIISIIITATIVVIQLYSSSFSTYAVKYFSKWAYFWVLLFIYTVVLLTQLVILGLIDDNNAKYYTIASISFGFGIFLFLIPYLLKVFNIIYPPSFIKKYIETELSRENVEDEKLQPILEMYQYVTKKGDYLSALKIIDSITPILIQNIKNRDEQIKNSSIHFLSRCGNLCITAEDEEIFIDYLNNYSSICISLYQDSCSEDINILLETIRKLGVRCANKGWIWGTIKISELIRNVGIAIVNAKDATNIENIYEIGLSIGTQSLNNKLYGGAREIIKSENLIINKLIETNWLQPIELGFLHLTFLAQECIKSKNNLLVTMILDSITENAILLCNSNKIDDSDNILYLYLNMVEWVCDFKSDEKIIVNICNSLDKFRDEITNQEIQREITQMLVGFKKTCEQNGWNNCVQELLPFFIDVRYHQYLPQDW